MFQGRDTLRQRKAIRRSIEDTIAAFNARKASDVLQEYAQISDVVTTRGEHLRGRGEIEDRLEGLFQGMTSRCSSVLSIFRSGLSETTWPLPMSRSR